MSALDLLSMAHFFIMSMFDWRKSTLGLKLAKQVKRGTEG